MTATLRRALVAAALMVSAFVGAWAWTPRAHLADTLPPMQLEALFPKAFGEWRTDERASIQMIAPDVAAVLSQIYNQTLSRTYINAAGDRVMLSVAYGGDQSDSTRAHRPEVCYPAQGFQLMSSTVGTLAIDGDQLLPVRRLETRMGGRYEPVTYWIMVGDQPVVSGTQQKLRQMSYSTRGIIPDGLIVRVSTIDENTSRSFAVQDRFLRDLASVFPRGASYARVFGERAPG